MYINKTRILHYASCIKFGTVLECIWPWISTGCSVGCLLVYGVISCLVRLEICAVSVVTYVGGWRRTNLE